MVPIALCEVNNHIVIGCQIGSIVGAFRLKIYQTPRFVKCKLKAQLGAVTWGEIKILAPERFCVSRRRNSFSILFGRLDYPLNDTNYKCLVSMSQEIT